MLWWYVHRGIFFSELDGTRKLQYYSINTIVALQYDSVGMETLLAMSAGSRVWLSAAGRIVLCVVLVEWLWSSGGRRMGSSVLCDGERLEGPHGQS